MEHINYNSKESKSSRTGYVFYCMFEYFISLLVADAFLAKLLTYIGISDALAGIISSFISLAFVFQLFSIFILKRKINAKKLCITFETISQLCFVFLYTIPFLPVPDGFKSVLVVIAIIVAYAFKYVVSSILFKWSNSYIDPMHRGSFSATKEMISLFGGIIFSLVMGGVTDRFYSTGNYAGGFLFTAISVFCLTVINFVCLMKIKNCDINTQESAKAPMKEVFKNALFNKKFMPVIIATSLYSFGTYFTYGFLGVFKTQSVESGYGLGMSLFLVSAITMVANFSRLIISKPFGRYSDRKSYAKGMELGYFLMAGSYLAIAFTTPNTWFMIIVFTVLYNVGSAGVVQNTSNIVYSYVDSNFISQAMAFRSAISGIVGFVAAILGAKMLDVIQSAGNVFMGLNVYGQQVMGFISFICIMVSVAIIHFVVAKNKVIVQ